MIRVAKELLIRIFPHAFPHRDHVTMIFEVVEGATPVREVSLQGIDESADRLTPFQGEPEGTLTKAELMQLFHDDPATLHYTGKRSRPRTKWG